MNPRINTYDGVLDMKERIKMLRKAMDMTQQDFADHLGVKRNTVGQWECGINHVSNHYIVFICKEFNVNEEWLRNGSGDMFLSGCMPISNNKPSARLKLLRNTLNLTQQEFADRIGCKRNTVAKYEIDSSAPSTAVVSLICREFNVNEEWIRFGTGDMFLSHDISSSKASNRVKILRNTLDLTQREFGERICVKGTTIANYELGRNLPSDAIIFSICREFNVNEEWLRYGTGKIFKSDRDTAIVRLENLLASEPDDSFKHHFINKLADLSPSEWNSLEKAIDIFANITKNRTDQ